MDEDRTIQTFLAETMERMRDDITSGEMTFNEVERQFHDADGIKCGIWDQDVTLFTILTAVIPDPDYLHVALTN